MCEYNGNPTSGNSVGKLSHFSLVLLEEGVHFYKVDSVTTKRSCAKFPVKIWLRALAAILTGTIHHAGPPRVSGASLLMVG